jgi:hypothetical protein
MDYSQMLPEQLKPFASQGPWAIDVWLANVGRYDVAAAYASLFWPAFTEVDGCVLLGSAIPESYSGWKAKYGQDTHRIEAVLNHRHILDLFPMDRVATKELVLHLGSVLKEMWTEKLRRDFPDRRFVVSFPEDFNFSVDNPDITFYTNPQATEKSEDPGSP